MGVVLKSLTTNCLNAIQNSLIQDYYIIPNIIGIRRCEIASMLYLTHQLFGKHVLYSIRLQKRKVCSWNMCKYLHAIYVKALQAFSVFYFCIIFHMR